MTKNKLYLVHTVGDGSWEIGDVFVVAAVNLKSARETIRAYAGSSKYRLIRLDPSRFVDGQVVRYLPDEKPFVRGRTHSQMALAQ